MKRHCCHILLLALLAGGWVLYSLNQPYAGFDAELFVEVPRGTPASRIADMLADAGVVQSRWLFLAARAFNQGRRCRPASTGFTRPHPHRSVCRIARGDVFFYELVVPEGRNVFDIGAAVEQLGLFPASKFLEAARNPALIRDLDPQAPTLEGYLFPDTYKLSRHTTPDQLCRLMTGKFREAWPACTPRPTRTAPSPWLHSSRRRVSSPKSARALPASSKTACASA